MSAEERLLGILGWLIDAPQYGRLWSFRDGALIIENGGIREVGDYLSLSKKPRTRPVRWLDAGRFAVFPGAYLQTHLAENLEECEKVRHQFPRARDDTEVYETRAAGIPLGLGSDVAAGPQINLWQVMRSAIESQKARSFYQKHIPVPSPAEAFYLATQGAALALGKGSQIGSFEPGKEAHLIVMNYCALLPFHGSARVDLSSEDVLGLCIDRGAPGAVMESFVRGRSVYRALKQELF